MTPSDLVKGLLGVALLVAALILYLLLSAFRRSVAEPQAGAQPRVAAAGCRAARPALIDA